MKRNFSCDEKSVPTAILYAISTFGLLGMAAGPHMSSGNLNKDLLLFEALSAGLLLASVSLLICKRLSFAIVGFLTLTSILILIGGLTAQAGFRAIIEPFVLGGTIVFGPYFISCYLMSLNHN